MKTLVADQFVPASVENISHGVVGAKNRVCIIDNADGSSCLMQYFFNFMQFVFEYAFFCGTVSKIILPLTIFFRHASRLLCHALGLFRKFLSEQLCRLLVLSYPFVEITTEPGCRDAAKQPENDSWEIELIATWLPEAPKHSPADDPGRRQ